MVKRLLPILCLLSIATPAVAQIHASAANEPIRLDGVLDEPAWSGAEIITGFTQQEPLEGDPATEKTVVRILYDDNNLYIGIMCYDSEPDKIVHKQMSRDGNHRYDDRIEMIIDTYNDKRMAYMFVTNPNGMMLDATVSPLSGTGMSTSWDGIWDVRACITDQGWSCEYMIPFKTLRFPVNDIQVWGINFKRTIMRKHEEANWRSWRRNEGILNLSNLGTVTIDHRLASTHQLDVTPYVLSGIEKERNEDPNDTFKYGLDIKYGITSNTTLELTTKTDFAQIENDQEIINLTRFNTSYPEKRDFFLEGADMLDFTQGGMRMFYSRRIGISPTREMVPILAGAKLLQKSGDFNLGALTVQTEAEGNMPSTNYSVVRFKKDILEQSYVGGLVTSLYDEDGHDNQVVATDIGYRTNSFLGDKNLQIQSYLAGSITDGKSDDNLAGRVFVSSRNDTFNGQLLYHVRQEGFNPEIGFVDRRGVQQYIATYSWTPRVSLFPGMRKLSFTPFNINNYYDMDNRLMSSQFSFQPFGLSTDAEDSFEIDVQRLFERYLSDGSFYGGVIIPAGDYDWWQVTTNLRTGGSRIVSFSGRWQTGNYYDGNRQMYDADVTVNASRFYSVQTGYTYNSIDIFGHRFFTKEASGRLNVNFNTRLSTSTFVQWNNDNNEVIANFRLHYIPKAGSDLYFSYNHLLDEGTDNRFRTQHQTAIVKLDYTFRL